MLGVVSMFSCWFSYDRLSVGSRFSLVVSIRFSCVRVFFRLSVSVVSFRFRVQLSFTGSCCVSCWF